MDLKDKNSDTDTKLMDTGEDTGVETGVETEEMDETETSTDSIVYEPPPPSMSESTLAFDSLTEVHKILKLVGLCVIVILVILFLFIFWGIYTYVST